MRLIEANPIHAVGLVTTCAWSELSTAVPRLWGLLGNRLLEVPERLEPDRQLSVFLGRRGEIFTEFVGVAVPAETPDSRRHDSDRSPGRVLCRHPPPRTVARGFTRGY